MSITSNAAGGAKPRLQNLLDELSGRFRDADFDRIDRVIVEAQEAMVLKLGLDRSSLWQFKGPEGELVMTHIWQKPGWPEVPVGMVARANLPWARKQVESGRGFHFSRVAELPPEAEQDRQTFARYGPRSNVTVPLLANGQVFGALAFASLAEEHPWTESELAEIKLVGGLFAHILGQVRAQEHLAELREEMARSSRLILLGELAATLIHDISQPLSAIRSEVGALRFGSGRIAPDVLHALEENASRAGQILANLRGWIRNDACVPDRHAPGLLVEEVVGLMSPRMHALGIQVIHGLPADLPMVKVVAVEIRQVLANLLRNAADAMAGQSGCRRVEISARRKGAWVWMKVEDTGPGIPPGMEEKILSPLFTTRPDGTGMGLAICRRVINAHGGKIKASCRRGGGAKIEFSLPVAKK
jgi:signal transduction histidine kinase